MIWHKYSIEQFTPHNWTQQAKECYMLKGDCSRCAIFTHYHITDCLMRKSIIQLVRLYGVPNSLKKVTESFNTVIKEDE